MQHDVKAVAVLVDGVLKLTIYLCRGCRTELLDSLGTDKAA